MTCDTFLCPGEWQYPDHYQHSPSYSLLLSFNHLLTFSKLKISSSFFSLIVTRKNREFNTKTHYFPPTSAPYLKAVSERLKKLFQQRQGDGQSSYCRLQLLRVLWPLKTIFPLLYHFLQHWLCWWECLPLSWFSPVTVCVMVRAAYFHHSPNSLMILCQINMTDQSEMVSHVSSSRDQSIWEDCHYADSAAAAGSHSGDSSGHTTLTPSILTLHTSRLL